jgi:predicted benzoate:H+ symporter BenE
MAFFCALCALCTPSKRVSSQELEEGERDAAQITFLVTASGLTLIGIGSAF